MTWLVDARLVDVQTGRIDPRHLQIENGRVQAVYAERPAKAQGEVVDLAGAYVLPGFFDCHVHICANTHNANVSEGWANALPGTIALYAAQAARRLLMSGITTARDVGGWDYHEIAVREAIRAGWIEGPRLHCAGKILSITSSTTPYYRGMYAEADGADAVRKAARQQLAQGATFIKLLATGAVTSTAYEDPHAIQFQLAEIRAAVEIAEDNFTYVAAHAHAAAGICNAAAAGCRSIEHSVYGDEHAYRLMKEKGAYLVPTVCAMPALFKDAAIAAGVPEHIRARYRDLHELHVGNIALARRVGVRIAMGSDAGTPGNHCGGSMQELEVMVRKCGFAPLEAIQAATIHAASMMRVDKELGSVEPGKFADLIATRANPLDDITTLGSVALVMKDGRIVRHER
jgi:imidazolonepropionase-like amidohydrolase